MNDEHGRETFWDPSVRVAVIGALAILALFLLAETFSIAQTLASPTTAPADTIVVTGTGQVALAPDIAYVTFSVQNAAADVASAQAATTKQANAALAYIKKQGIADKDVTTLSYNISPRYAQAVCSAGTFCPQTETITGYQVAETVQVTVRDLAQVSPLLQGLGQQNVQNISGPSFSLANPSEGQDAARAKAIADAKQEAQTRAAQLGVRLGRIVSFNENGATPYPVFGMARNSMAASATPAPEVPVGENTYTANVSITYAIY